jgi:hypothetical protein
MVDAEDYDLWLRLAEQTQLANLNDVVLKRRHHPFQVSVTRLRQQALSAIAAQVAACSRRSGKPDPFLSVERITPSMLVQLGMDEKSQDAMLARVYLGRIRAMERAGSHSMARALFADLVSCTRWTTAEKWVIADLRLFEARLNWREGRLAAGLGKAVYALINRPVVLGRPIAQLLRSLGRAVGRSRAKSIRGAGLTHRLYFGRGCVR